MKDIRDFNEVTTSLLKEAVSKFGLPTPSIIGQETADQFSLLLSHCTDLNFVETILNNTQFRNANFNKEHIAIAYDNLLVKSGKKQCFGFVLKIVENPDGTSKSVPIPLEDEDNVDKRRKEFGLKTTLAEYIKNSEELLKKIKKMIQIII